MLKRGRFGSRCLPAIKPRRSHKPKASCDIDIATAESLKQAECAPCILIDQRGLHERNWNMGRGLHRPVDHGMAGAGAAGVRSGTAAGAARRRGARGGDAARSHRQHRERQAAEARYRAEAASARAQGCRRRAVDLAGAGACARRAPFRARAGVRAASRCRNAGSAGSGPSCGPGRSRCRRFRACGRAGCVVGAEPGASARRAQA